MESEAVFLANRAYLCASVRLLVHSFLDARWRQTFCLSSTRPPCISLSHTMIFMTPNLGGGEIAELMTRGGLRAPVQSRPQLDEKVERTG